VGQYFYNHNCIEFQYSVEGLQRPFVQLARNGYSIIVSALELYRWKKGGKLVQDAFPDLSPTDREFLINGLTPDDQDALYGPAEPAPEPVKGP
jgi:hypothetical protein